jgi:DNA-binding LacI/PurR family transcriptional regulator
MIMVSIKDIASACNVSIATVSKALNNHKDVSEATKIRISEAAKKMGYLPNSQARALKTNRTYNLGVLFTERAQSGLTHNYFGVVLDSLKKEAEFNGYDITFISQNIGDNRMTYYEHCIYRNVDGVVIVCAADYEDVGITELLNSNVPTVMIDYMADNTPSLVSDNVEGIATLVDYVYNKGHRKIAYIYGNPSRVSYLRLQSFKESLKRHKLDIRDEYLIEGDFHNPKLTESLTEKIMNYRDPPTCIFLPDDFSAIGALNTFEKLGLSVPDDISVVGYDGIMLSQVINPRLTTYKQDAVRLGSEAAHRLISLIKKEISPDEEPYCVKGCLLEGLSVKDLN